MYCDCDQIPRTWFCESSNVFCTSEQGRYLTIIHTTTNPRTMGGAHKYWLCTPLSWLLSLQNSSTTLKSQQHRLVSQLSHIASDQRIFPTNSKRPTWFLRPTRHPPLSTPRTTSPLTHWTWVSPSAPVAAVAQLWSRTAVVRRSSATTAICTAPIKTYPRVFGHWLDSLSLITRMKDFSFQVFLEWENESIETLEFLKQLEWRMGRWVHAYR